MTFSSSASATHQVGINAMWVRQRVPMWWDLPLSGRSFGTFLKGTLKFWEDCNFSDVPGSKLPILGINSSMTGILMLGPFAQMAWNHHDMIFFEMRFPSHWTKPWFWDPENAKKCYISRQNHSKASLKLTGTNIAPKIDGWKTTFLFRSPILRGYVSFREWNHVFTTSVL